MGQEHRLRLLHVGIAGHDGVDFLFCQGHKGFLQLGDEFQDVPDLVSQVEAHVEGNLVVAAPAGVHFPAHGPDPIDETPLDRHVDVLVGLQKPEGPGCDLRADFGQGIHDTAGVGRRDDPLPLQHPAVGDAPLDIMVIEPPVEGKRCREDFHEPVCLLREPSAPELLSRFSAHVLTCGEDRNW